MFKTLTAALVVASVLIAPIASTAQAAQPATKAPATATTVVKLKAHKRSARHHVRAKVMKHVRGHKIVKHVRGHKNGLVMRMHRHGKIVRVHKHDHLVTNTDSQCQQCQVKSGGAGVDRDAVPSPHHGREFGFERGKPVHIQDDLPGFARLLAADDARSSACGKRSG